MRRERFNYVRSPWFKNRSVNFLHRADEVHSRAIDLELGLH